MCGVYCLLFFLFCRSLHASLCLHRVVFQLEEKFCVALGWFSVIWAYNLVCYITWYKIHILWEEDTWSGTILVSSKAPWENYTKHFFLNENKQELLCIERILTHSCANGFELCWFHLSLCWDRFWDQCCLVRSKGHKLIGKLFLSETKSIILMCSPVFKLFGKPQEIKTTQNLQDCHKIELLSPEWIWFIFHSLLKGSQLMDRKK